MAYPTKKLLRALCRAGADNKARLVAIHAALAESYVPYRLETYEYGTNLVVSTVGVGQPVDLVLGAHYDALGPGANDNGAAVAQLVEVAKALDAIPHPRQNVEIVFFDQEEEICGRPQCMGSNAYSKRLAANGQVPLVVILDATGIGDTPIYSHDEAVKASLGEELGRRLGAFPWAHTPPSDSAAFGWNGLPAVLLSTVWEKDLVLGRHKHWGWMHTEKDNISTISFKHHAKLIDALIGLARSTPERTHAERAKAFSLADLSKPSAPEEITAGFLAEQDEERFDSVAAWNDWDVLDDPYDALDAEAGTDSYSIPEFLWEEREQ